MLASLSFVFALAAPVDMAPFNKLIGSWRGASSGIIGSGVTHRTYEHVYDGNFVRSETVSLFDPSDQYPEGEVHRDFGIFSYDPATETYRIREFFAEGRVLTFKATTVDSKEGVYVFVTELVENNIAPGVDARVTLTFDGEDTITETLDLGTDGEYRTYLTTTFVRVKP